MRKVVRVRARRFAVALLSVTLVGSMPGVAAFGEELGEQVAATAEAEPAEEQTPAEEQASVEEQEPVEEQQPAEETGIEQKTEEQQPAEEQPTAAPAESEPAEDEDPVALSAPVIETAGEPAPVATETEPAPQAEGITVKSGETVTVSTSDQFPTTIEAGATVRLGADITLNADQQIEALSGTFDGQGHTITLSGKPLANNVSGTIQNLGVTGTATATGMFEPFGSIAVRLSGVIQMTYSTATVVDEDSYNDLGGLVGEMTNGKILNSFFAGSIDGVMGFGFVGGSASGTITNSLYTRGYQSCGYNPSLGADSKVTDDFLKSNDAILTLNASAPDTGFTWVLQGGLPVLSSGTAEVVKDNLEKAIEEAKQYSEDDYTAESWRSFAEALAAAKVVMDNENATQAEVNAAITALKSAQDALERPKPTEPVAVPETATKISSASDLQNINPAENKYYVLTQDLTLDASFKGSVDLNGGTPAPFAGVFDGQGHTITFDGGQRIFAGVAKSGVIQNVNFTGKMKFTPKQGVDEQRGPLGDDMAGTILNCSTSVEDFGNGSRAVAGFARTLAGGSVINCISMATGTGGVLFGAYASGTLTNTHWAHGTKDGIFPASALVNSYAVSADDMRSGSFLEQLNVNRGQYGSAWNQDKDGNPYFGEQVDQAAEPEDAAAENLYTVTFKNAKTGAESQVADGILEVSTDDVQMGEEDHKTGHLSGQLSIVDGKLPAGSTVTWGTPDANKGNIAVSEDGYLHVYDNATGTVVATEHLADGSTRTAATIVVRAAAKPIDDFKVFYNGKELGGDSVAAVSGSEVRNLELRVHYTGAAKGEYVPVSYTRFSFEADDPSLIYSSPYSACFYFKKAGTGAIKVTSRTNGQSKTVKITSTYVPATSISLSYNEDGSTILLHGRNPLSQSAGTAGATGSSFLTDHAKPMVEPANASDRDNFTVTSSNPDVARYTTSGEIGFTPYKAGTTTFTAQVKNQDGRVITSDSREVTYAYTNPLTSVTLDPSQSDITLKAGASQDLKLIYTGKRDSEGYSVSEPGLSWSFKMLDGRDASGIVSIDRDVDGAWKRVEGAPDNNLYLASGNYKVTALKAGTVIATGTPIDQTAGAQPVTLTITVSGTAAVPEAGKLAASGIDSAAAYLDANRSTDGYRYGDEWEVYTFLRAGRDIDQKMLDGYLASLKAAKSEWTARPTDIERVGLALAAMGQDITDFDGVNLVELVCGNGKLGASYNEFVYALQMLNAAGVDEDATAGMTWTGDKIVQVVVDGLDGQDADMIAMALQALAPYKARGEVQAVIASGLATLQAKMNIGTCDFGSAETNAQVLLALVALGIDPTDVNSGFANAGNNLITAIDAYRAADGGFRHVKGGNVSSMATLQVLQALSAYQLGSGASIAWMTTAVPGTGKNDGSNGGSNDGQTGTNNGNNTGNSNTQTGGSNHESRPEGAVAGGSSGNAGNAAAPSTRQSSTSPAKAVADEATTTAETEATPLTADAGTQARAAAVAKATADAMRESNPATVLALTAGGVGVVGLVAAAALYTRNRKRAA